MKSTQLDRARADALFAALARRQTIAFDADFFAHRRKLGWNPAACIRAAELLAEQGRARFTSHGESLAIELEGGDHE